MARQVYLMKRRLRSTHKNGQPKHRYTLRWFDPETGRERYESTTTSDRTQAEELRKKKWAEINRLVDPEPEPAPRFTWDECSEALEGALIAHNCRPSYVSDVLGNLRLLRKALPKAASPSDVTPEMANQYKRMRAEAGKAPSTIKGDLSTLRATFGKWLNKELGLLTGDNPFADVEPPICDQGDIRIVMADETANLFTWLLDRWNNWQLPVVYLRVAALVGWRATETASIREEDLLGDGYLRVTAATSKTRKQKYGRLPEELYEAVVGCKAEGWAFGRFSQELRRQHIAKKCPHLAARVMDFEPKRLVGWMQDELQRFCEQYEGEPFTLHDFRRTAITGMQMAGASEKETSTLVGASPEVIRKYYERLDKMAIADRVLERRLASEEAATIPMVRG